MTNDVVHQTEVDGVPTFWVEEPGRHAGGLLFRVGQADEELHRRGTTHLVEHLVLSSAGLAHSSFNGSVGQTTTSFIAAGSQDELCTFLTGVTRSLASLPWARVATEVRILETEAASRGGSALGAALAARYGAQAYGLPGFPELGLHDADPTLIDEWRMRWFTRANATLWLVGPPPAGLDLTALPPGTPRPAHEPDPLAAQRFPCWRAGPSGAVVLVMPLPTSQTSADLLAVTGRRLRQRLRHEEGLSYTVETTLDVLTARSAHGIIVADCLPEQAATVLDAFRSELAKLVLHGPTEDECREVHALGARPLDGSGLAAADAEAALLGRHDRVRLDVADPHLLADVLDRALQEAVWCVPRHVGMQDRRIHAVGSRPLSSVVVDGVPLERSHPASTRHPQQLVVGAEGLSLCWSEGSPVTMTWTSIAAVQQWQDGGRTLWGRDGTSVDIHVGEWTDGEVALAAVDQGVEAERLVPMPADLGPAALAPPEPRAEPPTALSIVGKRLVDSAFLVGMLVFGFLAIGIAMAPETRRDGALLTVIGALCATAAVVLGWTYRTRRRR